ncbi:MAG: DUF4160 domain-containing protein [Leptolyngbyaceae cyanobacterium SL_5_14]|nr:DUF4160 domain-containing protein [Leptolyngbyaceae cyanobacterium SL_5_14]
MPEVARFYGIIIKVFFGDHPPPHFHAIYGEYNALVSALQTGKPQVGASGRSPLQ